jgi:nitrogen regulatory protein PII
MDVRFWPPKALLLLYARSCSVMSLSTQSMLKLIRCVVPLESWETVFSSVVSLEAGVTAYDARDIDRSRRGVYRGYEYQVALPAMVMEIMTDDSWVCEIIAAIQNAHTFNPAGSRVIEILPVQESYRIRDGFMDSP